MSALELFYAATVVAFFAHWVYRELHRPKGPGSTEARLRSLALALIVGGCAVLVYERADDRYGTLSALGLALVGSGFAIDITLAVRRRLAKSTRSKDDSEPND